MTIISPRISRPLDAEPPEATTTHSLFQEPWWLDAVAPGSWRTASVERGGKLVARLPYRIRRRGGLVISDLPPLTQTLGPWLIPAGQGSLARRLGDEKELMNALIDQLPPLDIFQQSFNHRVTNWMPFHWRGFRQTTRYTYVLEELSDLDRVWAGLQSDARTNIRKAEKRLGLCDDLGAEALYRLVEMTFHRQGLRVPFSKEALSRVVEEAVGRGRGYLRFAVDAQGRTHGAVFNVFDQRSAFGLVSGFDPELRASGANALLIWESIRHAHRHTRAFDFEGSMLEPVEAALRTYGGVPKPYFRVTWLSRRARVLEAGKEIAKALLGR